MYIKSINLEPDTSVISLTVTVLRLFTNVQLSLV